MKTIRAKPLKRKCYGGSLASPIAARALHLSSDEYTPDAVRRNHDLRAVIDLLHINVSVAEILDCYSGPRDDTGRGRLLQSHLYHAAMDDVGRARHAKFPLLLQHYGIQPTSDGTHWQRLALALAVDHVPGFSTASSKAPGRINDAEIGIRWELLKRQSSGEKVTPESFATAYPGVKRRRGEGARMAFQRWAKTPAGRRLSEASEAELRLLVEIISR